MIWMDQVAKFVHNYILHTWSRCPYKVRMQTDDALCRSATTPAFWHVFNT